MQFVIFKPLSHCFEETIWFDVKASFPSRPESRLIRWYNYLFLQEFSWIENYKLNGLRRNIQCAESDHIWSFLFNIFHIGIEYSNLLCKSSLSVHILKRWYRKVQNSTPFFTQWLLLGDNWFNWIIGYSTGLWVPPSF